MNCLPIKVVKHTMLSTLDLSEFYAQAMKSKLFECFRLTVQECGDDTTLYIDIFKNIMTGLTAGTAGTTTAGTAGTTAGRVAMLDALMPAEEWRFNSPYKTTVEVIAIESMDHDLPTADRSTVACAIAVQEISVVGHKFASHRYRPGKFIVPNQVIFLWIDTNGNFHRCQCDQSYSRDTFAVILNGKYTAYDGYLAACLTV